MATKELVKALSWRSVPVRLDNVAAIAVKYGSGPEPGHASAR
jgi:hypothetical protein